MRRVKDRKDVGITRTEYLDGSVSGEDELEVFVSDRRCVKKKKSCQDQMNNQN